MSAHDREHPGRPDGNGHANGHAAGYGSPSTLDAYLDGRLAGAARSAFEARLGSDPRLAAELDAQHRIDGSLRRMFVVPPVAALPPTNGHPAPADAGAAHAPRAAAAVAGLALSAAAGDAARAWTAKALLLGGLISGVLLVAASWLAYNAMADDRQGFDEVYRRLTATPAQPASTRSLTSACPYSLAHHLAARKPPPGVELVGVSDAPVLSDKTVVLRARVDGRDVLLFADLLAFDDPAVAATGHADCGLRLFRRDAGGMVFYELTPHDAPRLLAPYASAAAEAAEGQGCVSDMNAEE